MRCIIYGLRHDAIVIDCNALRFGTRWSEVFAITTMESSKVNGKIFISAYVAIRSCNLLHRSPFIPFPPPIIATFPRVFVTPFLPTRRGWKSCRKRVPRSHPILDESIILSRASNHVIIRKRMEKLAEDRLARLSLVWNKWERERKKARGYGGGEERGFDVCYGD